MKKLVFVLSAIAALVVAACFILFLSPRPVAVTSLPAAEPVSSPTPSSASPTPTSDQSVQPSAVEPQDTTSHREPERQPNTQDVLPSSQARRPQTAPPKSETQQMAACRELWDSRRKREQAAHDAEAKDPTWAYAMEQQLREYASRRLQGTSMELTEIDCKTTYCDLVAQVLEPDTMNELNAALDDAKKQPWSDFSGTSYAKISETGNAYRIELLRRHSYQTPFDAENNSEASVACMRLTSQLALRERAARDAQPRDAAWADQIEPLLRQHIVSRMVKHPVEKLEIDCKTTFCRIKAGGQTEDSQRLFQQVSQEAAAEPWADLRVGEAGSSGYGNRWTADVTLYRQ